jgi:hypothetical protein
VYAESSRLFINQATTFLGNLADDSGGALYLCKQSSLSAKNSIFFHGNSAGSYGGWLHLNVFVCTCLSVKHFTATSIVCFYKYMYRVGICIHGTVCLCAHFVGSVKFALLFFLNGNMACAHEDMHNTHEKSSTSNVAATEK